MHTKNALLPIKADVHMHTDHSHGVATVQQMFDAACQKGLQVIGFSEHSPRPQGYTYPQDYQDHLAATFDQYIASVQSLKQTAKQQGITVLLGLELDYIPAQEEYAQALCKAYPYDYIIGGVHFQGTWGFDGPAQDWDVLSTDQRFAIYKQYYKDLTQMCKSGLFQIAAHPDLIKMSSITTFNQWLTTPQAIKCIDDFLAALLNAGMVMEVSSAGLRKACNEIYPGPVVMERAAKMGVAISFGADSHCTNTPAYAFDTLAQYARSFGYTSSVIFRQKAPQTLAFSTPVLL